MRKKNQKNKIDKNTSENEEFLDINQIFGINQDANDESENQYEIPFYESFENFQENIDNAFYEFSKYYQIKISYNEYDNFDYNTFLKYEEFRNLVANQYFDLIYYDKENNCWTYKSENLDYYITIINNYLEYRFINDYEQIVDKNNDNEMFETFDGILGYISLFKQKESFKLYDSDGISFYVQEDIDITLHANILRKLIPSLKLKKNNSSGYFEAYIDLPIFQKNIQEFIKIIKNVKGYEKKLYDERLNYNLTFNFEPRFLAILFRKLIELNYISPILKSDSSINKNATAHQILNHFNINFLFGFIDGDIFEKLLFEEIIDPQIDNSIKFPTIEELKRKHKIYHISDETFKNNDEDKLPF